MSKIGIINYGSGNFKSVCNALNHLNISWAEITSNDHFSKVSHIILPGVGTYRDCMERLEKMDIIDILKNAIKSDKKYFLGICVGMQVLTKYGTEFGKHEGLGVINGKTGIINKNKKKKNTIPHIGWTEVTFKKNSKIYQGIENNSSFYFLHSYRVQTTNTEIISGTVDYGDEIIASLESKKIYGVQFHPEKSQMNGLRLLNNFSNL